MLVSPLDITPRWVRQRGTPKDLRQAQTISSIDTSSTTFQSFPSFFVLGEEATSSHARVELRVAVKGDSSSVGMVQRVLQVDVHAGKFSVLDFPSRHILETFQISHLVEASYPGELVVRLGFRQSIPGWIKERLQAQPTSTREQLWFRTFHTMTKNQRDYLGSLLQGLVGICRPLNENKTLLCSPAMLKVGREQLSLWIGTWNMGNKPAPDVVPSRRGLVSPIALWTNWTEGNEHDLYAFGLQEMDPSIFTLLDLHFLENGYVQVCRTNMGVIALTVFCKRRLFNQIRNVQTLVQACGFAGVGTNKGFVCCTMTVFDHPLLFINCHLAARDDAKRLKERIRQYKLAVKKLQLGKLPGTDPLHQHTTFFFGDMNFRVCTVDKGLWPNSNRTRLEVLDTLYKNKGLDYALQGDQLHLEQSSRGLIFDRFREASLTFSPTYKYLVFPKLQCGKSPVYAEFQVELSQTSSVVPTASFHVCAIQLLEVEVFHFRHPLTAVEGEEEDESGKVMQPGDDDEDDDEEEESLPASTLQQQLRKRPSRAVLQANSNHVEEGEDEFEDSISEPEIYTSSRNLQQQQRVAITTATATTTATAATTATTATATATAGKKALPPHLPQLVCAAVFPFMRETASKSRITSKPSLATSEAHTWTPNCELTLDSEPEFVFRGNQLVGMAAGPFLCTREFLQNQYFVLHVLPKQASETRDSAACCVVSLEEGADGRTVNFEQPLSHYGQPSGFVRGKYRVWLNNQGWEEECVANPALHPLTPKNLTRHPSTKQQAVSRRSKSPPPEGRAVPVHPLPSLRVKINHNINEEEYDEDEERLLLDTMELVASSRMGEEDGSEEGDEDALDELTRLNTIRNHSAPVTRVSNRV
ncbi:hypothetical protein BASA81_009147 [Batrachochytrium salamandrivorans]|nr:hypothetical protein BASA81_009147 [Batrachochytrium salamandrivorans]